MWNPKRHFFGFFSEKANNWLIACFYAVLVVVWDNFIYEPISALIGKPAGLFTEGSFAKDENGQPLKFVNVDCVIVTRYGLQIKRGTTEESMPYLGKHRWITGGRVPI